MALKQSIAMMIIVISPLLHAKTNDEINFYTTDSIAGCEVVKTHPMISVYDVDMTDDNGKPQYQNKAIKKAQELGANAVVGVNISNLRGVLVMHGTPVAVVCEDN